MQLVHLARLLLWIISFAYLAIETREFFSISQLLDASIFTLFFLLASLQLSISRLLHRSGELILASQIFRASKLLILAAFFDLYDFCIDTIISQFSSFLKQYELNIYLYALSWLLTIISIIMALISLDIFLRSIKLMPLTLPEKSRSGKITSRFRKIGSRDLISHRRVVSKYRK